MEKLIEALKKYPDGTMVTPHCEGYSTRITGVKENPSGQIFLEDEDHHWWHEEHCIPVNETQNVQPGNDTGEK